MMVQTLVENGVKHGLATLTQGGELTVAASVTGEDLTIRVTNSGQLSDEPSSEGIGLNNARKRLKLHYGERASFSIANQTPHLVSAQITIPLEASLESLDYR